MQEVEVGQIVQYVCYGPGYWHGENWQGYEHHVKDCEEEQIHNPDAPAVPPGNFRICQLRSCSRTQHDLKYALSEQQSQHD